MTKVFIIHGTDPNGYVREVEDACRTFGLDPVRMMQQPNRGMSLPDKLRDSTTASDFYVAILTHDETTTDGGQRARQNAIAETLLANQNWPDRLVILREGEVEIPTNLQGLVYIQLKVSGRCGCFRSSRRLASPNPDKRRYHVERDHTHRDGGGNIVIGKPSTDEKPAVGDMVKVGGHVGRVVDGSPWGTRWVNPPAESGIGLKASLDEDVAIQVVQDKAEEPRLSLYRIDAVSSDGRTRIFYAVARSSGEAVGDVVQGVNEIAARRGLSVGLDTRGLVVTELPNHFPLEVFRNRLEPMSLESPLFS